MLKLKCFWSCWSRRIWSVFDNEFDVTWIHCDFQHNWLIYFWRWCCCKDTGRILAWDYGRSRRGASRIAKWCQTITPCRRPLHAASSTVTKFDRKFIWISAKLKWIEIWNLNRTRNLTKETVAATSHHYRKWLQFRIWYANDVHTRVCTVCTVCRDARDVVIFRGRRYAIH